MAVAEIEASDRLWSGARGRFLGMSLECHNFNFNYVFYLKKSYDTTRSIFKKYKNNIFQRNWINIWRSVAQPMATVSVDLVSLTGHQKSSKRSKKYRGIENDNRKKTQLKHKNKGSVAYFKWMIFFVVLFVGFQLTGSKSCCQIWLKTPRCICELFEL